MTASVRALESLRAALAELGVSYDEPAVGTVVVLLPGEHKLRTTCSLVVGAHGVSVNAFVVRRPDENADVVHRWLLRRNARGGPVAFSLDHLGDIYLTGRLALGAVTAVEIDTLLGTVLELSDSSFDTLLRLGFAGAIRREWAWRSARGESTANLAALISEDANE